MDKIKLKRLIKDFALNIGLATAMFTLALTYLPIVIQGEGHWALFICDLICFCADTVFATMDWRKIKTMLTDSEKVDESAK